MKRELLCTLVLGGLLSGSAVAGTNAQLMLGENSDVSNLIGQMKRDGQPIPADLRQLEAELYGIVFDNTVIPANRDGGNNAGSATPIVFTAGVYNDLGTTIGKGNQVNNNTISPLANCTNSSYSTSMDAEDAWYLLSVTAEGIITADTRLAGTNYDTCIAILDLDGVTVKSINDDGEAAPWRSYLECCLAPGQYYFVVDGYSAADIGNYELLMTFTENDCIPDAFECPANAQLHIEGDEVGCGDFIHDLDCGETFCGEISDSGDSDYFWILVDAPNTTIVLNVYGDDTPGRPTFGWGLDPYIRVWDMDCQTVIAEDDDGGTGYDSFLRLECMEPGFYVIEVNTEWNDPGPYLLTLGCEVCCWETNTASNPDILIDSTSFMNYVGEANSYTTTVSLCDYCNIIAVGPGCFGNGHCILDMDAGEYWFNVYQPNPAAGCYALMMRTSPAYTPTCNTIIGVAQGGTLLGYFALDAANGLFPSVYNEPAMPGQTTFVLDATASCCDLVNVSIWYEDLCPPVAADELPSTFTLEQNYPNPFNPTTSISFSLPETGTASLRVFDMTGREVATLVNGMTERGTHTVSFDASNLGTGVYFYTLQSGSFTTTKKMVLVK
ncbi:MAG: T9SS type A sorting domain-containing protein [bacterium]|nr:T9SS type A sorting domain-containing protein [bacterium]